MTFMTHNDLIISACDLIKGTRSTSHPHINPHPDTESVLYVGYGNMTLMNLDDLSTVVKDKDLSACSFRHTAVAPAGNYDLNLPR